MISMAVLHLQRKNPRSCLEGTIDVRESEQVHCQHTMIRKLFILAFVVSVAGNSLAAVSPHADGEGGCAADCCRAARHNKPEATLAKLCCLTRCNQPGETQGSPATSLLSYGPDERTPSLVGVCIEDVYSAQPWEAWHSPAGLIVQSTHIYLTTGTLLI